MTCRKSSSSTLVSRNTSSINRHLFSNQAQLRIFKNDLSLIVSSHWQRFFTCSFGTISALLLLLAFVPKSHALSLGPLKLNTAYGKLRVVNTSEDFAKVKFVVYPAKVSNGIVEIITEFDEYKLNSSVKLTPNVVRMSGLSERSINYSIKDQSKNYLLCAENLPNSQYMLRICALWTSL